jgi:MoxR-like ATPase
MDCPLETLIGCSNELPEDLKALGPLYDRFPIRIWVGYIKRKHNWKEMLLSPIDKIKEKITLDELHELQDQVDAVEIDESIIDLMWDIKTAISKESKLQDLDISDRRWVQCLTILQAHAFLHGRDSVTEDDLLYLPHCLWDKPEQLNALIRVIGETANPLATMAQEMLDEIRTVFESLPVSTDIPESDSSRVFKSVMEINSQIKKAVTKLTKESNAKSNHIVIETINELKEMHSQAEELGQRVSGLE